MNLDSFFLSFTHSATLKPPFRQILPFPFNLNHFKLLTYNQLLECIFRWEMIFVFVVSTWEDPMKFMHAMNPAFTFILACYKIITFHFVKTYTPCVWNKYIGSSFSTLIVPTEPPVIFALSESSFYKLTMISPVLSRDESGYFNTSRNN